MYYLSCVPHKLWLLFAFLVQLSYFLSFVVFTFLFLFRKFNLVLCLRWPCWEVFIIIVVSVIKGEVEIDTEIHIYVYVVVTLVCLVVLLLNYKYSNYRNSLVFVWKVCYALDFNLPMCENELATLVGRMLYSFIWFTHIVVVVVCLLCFLCEKTYISVLWVISLQIGSMVQFPKQPALIRFSLIVNSGVGLLTYSHR